MHIQQPRRAVPVGLGSRGLGQLNKNRQVDSLKYLRRDVFRAADIEEPAQAPRQHGTNLRQADRTVPDLPYRCSRLVASKNSMVHSEAARCCSANCVMARNTSGASPMMVALGSSLRNCPTPVVGLRST